MTNHAKLSDTARITRIGMDDHPVLKVGAHAHGDGFVVSPQDRLEPDRSLVGQGYLPDKVSARSNKACQRNVGRMLGQRKNHLLNFCQKNSFPAG